VDFKTQFADDRIYDLIKQAAAVWIGALIMTFSNWF
jgi:hypothetical protein